MNEWLVDSDCSKYMIEDANKCTTFEYKNKRKFSYDNNGEVMIINIGNIELTSNFVIKSFY